MHILRVFWLIFFLSGWAFADELYIYPAKGQSQDQEEKDKFQCYQFGKKQTGFDPMKAPTATSQELDDARHDCAVGRATRPRPATRS